MVAVCSSGKYFTGPGPPFLLWLALLPKSHAGIVGKERASPSKSRQESRQKSPRVKRLIVQTVALMFWLMQSVAEEDEALQEALRSIVGACVGYV